MRDWNVDDLSGRVCWEGELIGLSDKLYHFALSLQAITRDLSESASSSHEKQDEFLECTDLMRGVVRELNAVLTRQVPHRGDSMIWPTRDLMWELRIAPSPSKVYLLVLLLFDFWATLDLVVSIDLSLSFHISHLPRSHDCVSRLSIWELDGSEDRLKPLLTLLGDCLSAAVSLEVIIVVTVSGAITTH